MAMKQDSLTPSIPQPDMGIVLVQLRNWYRFRSPARVEAFLIERPALLPLLTQAQGLVQRFFPGTQPSLEVVTDPELRDLDYRQQLIVAIKTNLESAAAVEQLHEFDEAWWQATGSAGINGLCFTLERDDTI